MRLPALLCVAALAGCGPSAATKSATKSVDPSTGATVGVSDGSASVSIGAGALASPTTITVSSSNMPPPSMLGTTVGTTYVFGPEGLQFLKPVTITVAVDPTKLPQGKTINDVIIVTAPAGSTSFTPLMTMVADSTHVAAQTMHFSQFAPLVGATTDCVIRCGRGASASAGACIVYDGGPGTVCPDMAGYMPMYSCECQATCMGTTYAMNCDSTGNCSCSANGTKMGMTTVTDCASTGTWHMSSLTAFSNGCHFPGTAACDYQCGGGGGPQSGGSCSPSTGPGSPGTCADGGTTTTTGCGCTGTCMGHDYNVGCQNGSCTCDTDGTAGTNFQLMCSDSTTAATAYTSNCQFPGTPYIPATTSGGTTGGTTMVDSGTPTGTSGGSTGGTGGGTFDASAGAPPDFSTTGGTTGGSTGGTAGSCTRQFMLISPSPPPGSCAVAESCNGTSYGLQCSTKTPGACQCMMNGAPVGSAFNQTMECQMNGNPGWGTNCGFPN